MDLLRLASAASATAVPYTAAETVRNLDRRGSSLDMCGGAELPESDSGAPAGDSPSSSEDEGSACAG